MKAAQPRDWFDTAHGLRRSVERSIFVKRKVRACPAVVGAIFCQQIAEVTFAEHHDMVVARRSCQDRFVTSTGNSLSTASCGLFT